MRVTMRFSSETLCSERTLCVVDHSLGLHPRDFSRIVWPGSPDRPHVALSDACCRGPHRSGLVHSTTPSMRFGPPLATSPVEFGIPGFPPPAPSALVFSQHYSGFLLQLVCLSCFIQAPPMGFKEQGRTHRGCPVKQRSPSGETRAPGGCLGHHRVTERETLLSTEVSSTEVLLPARWRVP